MDEKKQALEKELNSLQKLIDVRTERGDDKKADQSAYEFNGFMRAVKMMGYSVSRIDAVGNESNTYKIN